MAFIICGCHQNKIRDGKALSAQNEHEKIEVRYAEGFHINKYDGYAEVIIMNPWEKGKELRRYYLVDKTKELPDGLPEGNVIRIPIGRVACYSSIQCSILDELGVIDSVAGVCEPQYVNIPIVRDKVKTGAVIDLGLASNPDIEKIMLLNPEVILTSPLKEVGYGKIESVNIPLIDCVDYMESSPLGRAEWIRFLGLLFNKEALADSLFKKTEQSYLELKTLATSAKKRPTVITEKKYGGIWHLPGGRSYAAHFLRDAGSAYFWENDSTTGSLPFAFETVLDKCEHADFWLIKYYSDRDLNYEDIEAEYGPYRVFTAFRNKTIFGCNTSKTSFYEDLLIHPDYHLKDLISIFHPELLSDYKPKYYKKLDD